MKYQQTIKNILLPGSDNRLMGLDIFYQDGTHQRPVVIYAHGFNGFKDWGNFDLVAARFAAAGYVMVKFNFSHNGTIPEKPQEFADLQAFGNNNYTRELEDLRIVTDWVYDPANPFNQVIDRDNICLIGHSMGGGICILHAAEDARVKKLITWAGVSECKTPWGNWPPGKIEEWKTHGVQYYTNTRTNQQMPMYYQLYEDFVKNQDRLNIKKAIKRLSIPILICHGSLDSSVPVEKAYELKEWQPMAQLFTVESDHVFGRKHPWTEDYLPAAMEAVIEASLQFLNEQKLS